MERSGDAGVGDRTASVLMLAYTNYEIDPRVIRAAEAALEARFAVDVIALRREGQEEIETIRGVRVHRLRQQRQRGRSRLRYLISYGQFMLRCAVESARLCMLHRYQVVHVHNMPDVLVFAALVPRLLGARILLDIHDPMPETYGAKYGSAKRTILGRVLLFLERLSIGFADATVTVSEPVRSGILAKRGYSPESVSVVANFADDGLFRMMVYPAVSGKVRFVFHGTILARYGLGTLMEALARTRHQEKVQVRIIGEGDYSQALAALVRRKGLEDVVEFLNRAYPLHEIPGLLADCHVGLVPLDLQGSAVADFALPLKLLEYTCLGIPAITIRNAAIEHYFRPDECMYFDSGDTAALARLIDAVAENPDQLHEYRKRIEVARERFCWSKEKVKYVRLLHDLVA